MQTKKYENLSTILFACLIIGGLFYGVCNHLTLNEKNGGVGFNISHSPGLLHEDTSWAEGDMCPDEEWHTTVLSTATLDRIADVLMSRLPRGAMVDSIKVLVQSDSNWQCILQKNEGFE